ncbi:hypothetical protein VTK73DRAFT_3746 [Phialemonium thermophilum]|uniref:NDT80 domain-containing protein n=1 Tax=Phialemonium thermophilum TaxID=223376 RepID=A0ABR3WXJ4_9PEZI
MADLKTEPQNGGLWSTYGSPVQASGRFTHLDSAVSNPSTASPHLGRPRSSNPQVDYPSQPYYGRHSQDDGDAYDRQQSHALQTHHSYPSLKRPYSQTADQPPYNEIVQDMRDEGSKMGVNHDHKLLSFRKTPDKYTIVDQHGRIQQLELSAQLHGMFFLSEMPSGSSDTGGALQPELTCYRRNLFQISGSLITPRSPLSVVTETGETVPVSSTEVTISAVESVDGHPVRLIVIPWKTPPPNSPEISQAPDQEPPSLPLIPFQSDGTETDGEYAVYPLGWRRLQFRIATANNGRRKELQQHFILHLRVVGTLSNGSKVVLAESVTAPIVVRGRSPRNFQARKEIPLLGSSAGSRGQALVETGLGIVAGPLTAKTQDPKGRPLNMELPRAAFTFGPPKLPQSPMGMRTNSYPTTWNQPNPISLTHIPASGPDYPAATLATEPYQKMPLSGSQSFTSDPQDMPLQTTMSSVPLSLTAQDHQQTPIRTQYATYVQGTSAPPQLSLPSTSANSLSIPRYMDDGSRPSKSPRHANQPSVHGSANSLANDTTSNEYRYGPPYVGVNNGHQAEISPAGQQATPYGASAQDSGSAPPSGTLTTAPPPHQQPQPPPPRDYYPPPQPWTTAPGEPAASTAPYSANGGADHRSYGFPDQYKTGNNVGKPEPLHAQSPNPSPGVYTGPASLGHYSWSTT